LKQKPAQIRQMLFTTVLVLIMTMVALAALAAEATTEPPKVVARGDGGLVVTAADLGAMKGSFPNFVPTREALLQATVRTVLFAREVEGVRCAAAAEKEGFARQLALSRCYLRQRLEQVKLLPGAVESYYRVHWHRYTDEQGKVKPLDDNVRRRIRARILRAKKKDFAKLEYERLCKKYHVVIAEKAGLAQ